MSRMDSGRASAAAGILHQIEVHAEGRRKAEKGSAEYHHHHEQLQAHLSMLQKIDSTLHASTVSVVALQDRLNQSRSISSSLSTDERRERSADPKRREAIARDRATLRSAKDLIQKRLSGVDNTPRRSSGPRQPRDTALTYEEWKSQNG